MTPVDALRRALDILRERGWTRLACEDHQGRVCLRTAVMLGSDGDLDAAHGACVLLFESGCRGGYMTESGPRAGIEGWNDSLDDMHGRAHVESAITRAINLGTTRRDRVWV